MDLMEQCQRWNENDQFQNIIDAIEALPEEARTPELDSELARAYNNLAKPGDRALFEKAAALLEPHEAYFQGNHSWNFRLAYAYYYLDWEGEALRYFERALEARPGDPDTLEYIEDCRKRLALPRFETPFRARVAESWALFRREEGELRRLLDQKDREGASRELLDRCQAALAPALGDANFELGFNGQKYELILTPDGARDRLFPLVYFRRYAPQGVLERWNILVGRQRSGGFALRHASCEQDISAEDVQAWVETRGDAPGHGSVSLTLYCEKLLPLLREQEGMAWWLLATLTDQVLGEVPSIAYLNGMEVVDAPKGENGMALSALPQALEAMGMDLALGAEGYLENGYVAYQMEPSQDPEADWRLDVFAGSIRCPALLNEYLRGESRTMDEFHRLGAVPGFIVYPLDCFAGEAERGKAALEFREALEAALTREAGADAVTFLGGATGISCGYLDFIAWDLEPVLKAAAVFFQNSPMAWAAFHTFRRGVGTVRLKREE